MKFIVVSLLVMCAVTCSVSAGPFGKQNQALSKPKALEVKLLPPHDHIHHHTVVSTKSPATSRRPSVEIVKSYDNRYPDGSYEYFFSTSDGQEKFEKGTIQADQTFVVEGYYTYTDTDNNKVVRKYRSDKDGYQIIE